MENILGQRLKSARIMNGYSMDKLCKLLCGAVSKQAISKYENGQMMPNSTNLILLSNALNVSIDYLFKPSNFNFSKIEFRKYHNLSDKKISNITENVIDKVERYFEIEEILNLNNPFDIDFSDLIVKSKEDVVEQAKRLRSILNLGDDGISNVISVLEENGIKIVEVDSFIDFDGLCGFINKENPVIVVSNKLDSEGIRFTAFHELGHLLLNFEPLFSKIEIEELCDIFASEMLIPSKQFVKLIGSSRKDISLKELIPIQQQYGISIDALMRKAKWLNIISNNRYNCYLEKKRNFPDFNSSLGMSRIPNESSSRFISLVYRAISDEIISISKASSLLRISVKEIKSELNYI